MLNITNSPLLHPSGEVRLSPLSITTALVWRLLSFLHVLSLPENSRRISVRIQPGRLPLICLRNISKLFRMALLKSKNKKALFFVREFVCWPAKRVLLWYQECAVNVDKTSFSPDILHLGATASLEPAMFTCAWRATRRAMFTESSVSGFTVTDTQSLHTSHQQSVANLLTSVLNKDFETITLYSSKRLYANARNVSL